MSSKHANYTSHVHVDMMRAVCILTLCSSLRSAAYTFLILHIAIVNSPASQNATLGDVANFTCSVKGTTVIYWHVDGIPHNSVGLNGRGIGFSSSYDGALDIVSSVLSVACKQQNNNSVIRCFGYNNRKVISSPSVKLLIQGTCTYI